jgi:hypothetical protein
MLLIQAERCTGELSAVEAQTLHLLTANSASHSLHKPPRCAAPADDERHQL